MMAGGNALPTRIQQSPHNNNLVMNALWNRPQRNRLL
jgi:hypothetical protein